MKKYVNKILLIDIKKRMLPINIKVYHFNLSVEIDNLGSIYLTFGYCYGHNI